MDDIERHFHELDAAIAGVEEADPLIATSPLTNPLDNLYAAAKRDRAILWRIWDYMALWDEERELQGADFVEFMCGLMREDWKGDSEPTPPEHRNHSVYPDDHWEVWGYDDEPDVDDGFPEDLEYGMPGVNSPPDTHMHEDAHLEMEFEDRISGGYEG